MQTPATTVISKATVEGALQSLENKTLRFPAALEAQFETDTRKTRSHRMWFEGLIAILVLNFCLILDYAIVRDIIWLSIVEHTAIITPLALAINMLVRKNPPGWLRESSIAAAMVAICLISLAVLSNRSTTSTLYGAICVLITALFVAVVMRLRFPYTAISIAAMLAAGIYSVASAPTIHLSESVVGNSIVVIALGIILVASHSLEREERRNYLLSLQRNLQTQELASINEALQELSSIDKLTGLPNRRALEDRFDRTWTACALSGQPLSAIVIDVDHFKLVNDTYGHLYGDETLRRIGSLLPQALRSSNDMAARFGGEEFVLLLPYADPETAITVAERTRLLVEHAGTPLTANPAREATMWITVSCGVSSCIPSADLQWSDLVAAADEALYAAKHAGRNCVEFRNCHPQRSALAYAFVPHIDESSKDLFIGTGLEHHDDLPLIV